MGQRLTEDAAKERFAFLFDQVLADIHQPMKAILAAHSAKGLLQSGATIKVCTREANNLMAAAISSALDAIGLATAAAGRKRTRLLDELERQTGDTLARLENVVADRLEKVRLERQLVARMFDESRAAHFDLITQYRAGWTAPKPTSWKERHPTLYDITLALVSAAIGLVVGLLSKD